MGPILLFFATACSITRRCTCRLNRNQIPINWSLVLGYNCSHSSIFHIWFVPDVQNCIWKSELLTKDKILLVLSYDIKTLLQSAKNNCRVTTNVNLTYFSVIFETGKIIQRGAYEAIFTYSSKIQTNKYSEVVEYYQHILEKIQWVFTPPPTL